MYMVVFETSRNKMNGPISYYKRITNIHGLALFTEYILPFRIQFTFIDA